MIYLDLVKVNAGEGSRPLMYICIYLNLLFFFFKIFESYPTAGLFQGLKLWPTLPTRPTDISEQESPMGR